MKSKLIIALLALAPACRTDTGMEPSRLADQVTIYRDTWGVPHVHGETDAAAFFGLAYAYAEDRFQEIEEKTLIALGRYCEGYGIQDSVMFYSDFKNKVYQVEAKAKKQYDQLKDPYRKVLDAFAAGLNYYLDQHPEEVTVLLDRFQPWHFLAGDIHSALDIRRATYRYGMDLPSPKQASGANRRSSKGSNAWALAPAKTASGNTMLLINPHDPTHAPYYECHIMSKEGLNFYGVLSYYKISAMPDMGFNEYLGYALTLNRRDIGDAYRMTFDHPTDSTLYKFGNEYKKAEMLSFDIKIREGDRIKSEPFQVLNTIHGPVIKDGTRNNISYRMPENTTYSILEQNYDMIRSTHFAEWEKAISKNAKFEHNLTYADRDGNIYYLFAGRTPKRDTAFNWLEPVDGSNPRTLWQGYHPLAELPQLTNPSTGYVQNCNQSPFRTTHDENPDPSGFPKYMWALNQEDNARAARSRELLARASSVTLEDFHKMNFDTYLPGIDHYIELLAKEWEATRHADPQRYDRLKDPVKLMKEWDRHSHRESIATSLYVVWSDAYDLMLGFDLPEPGDQLRTFEKGLELLEEEFGAWQVPYGRLIRVQRSPGNAYGIDPDRPSFATDGNNNWMGIMFSMGYPSYDGKKLARRVDGDNSFVAHVEFTPGGPVANSLLSFGNSSRPGSPHYDDQTEMLAKGQMKKVNFTMKAILQNLEAEYKPGREKSKLVEPK